MSSAVPAAETPAGPANIGTQWKSMMGLHYVLDPRDTVIF